MRRNTSDSVTDNSLEVEEIEIEEQATSEEPLRRFWLLQEDLLSYNNKELGAAFIRMPLSSKDNFGQKKFNESMRRAIQQNKPARNSPTSVTNYSQKIKENDVLVSFNPIIKSILVGVAKSGYIHSYMLGGDKDVKNYHLLRADWRIKRSFDLPPELTSRHFVSALNIDQWNLIQTSLVEKYPGDIALQKELQLPKERFIQTQEDEKLLPRTDFIAPQKAAKRTRNIIFYGPPGTGKTWMVENFSTYLLLQKNASNRDANSYWDAIASRTVAIDDTSEDDKTDDASPNASSNNSDSSVKDTIRREVRGPLSLPSTRAIVWAIEPLHDRSHEHWARFFSNTQAENWDSAPQVFLEEAQSGDFILVNYEKDGEDLLGIAAVQTDSEQVENIGVKLFKIGPISMSPNPVLPKWESRFNNFEIVNAYGGARMYRLSEDQAQDIWRQFKKAGYTISHPGIAERVVTPAQNYYEVVTFHQSFSYEDFVEGLRPEAASDGQVKYVVQDGVFKQFSKKAERYWKELGDDAPQFVFVIDEINRANIAKVFGELISLIEDDKRLGQRNALSVTLPYSKEDFGIPPNLYIFGTMNTADRSLTIIDIALRRRFAFIEINPDATKLGNVKGLSLSALLTRINLRLRMVLDNEYKIGHSYFFNLEGSNDVEGLHFVWNQYIVPLLQEYFYGDIQRLRAFLGSEFMEGLEVEDGASDLSGSHNNEESNYQLKKLNADELLEALKKFVSK